MDDRISTIFGQLSVEKGRVARSALGSSGLPNFVVEWVVSSLTPGRGELTDAERDKLARATQLAPGRNSGPQIRDRLFRGESVQVIDLLEVDVRLGTHERRVASLQCTGLADCDIEDAIMDRLSNELLSSGMWGKA